jgi:hypothetical protein
VLAVRGQSMVDAQPDRGPRGVSKAVLLSSLISRYFQVLRFFFLRVEKKNGGTIFVFSQNSGTIRENK